MSRWINKKLPVLHKYIGQNVNLLLIISQSLLAIPSIAYVLISRGRAVDNIETNGLSAKVIFLLVCFTLSMIPVISFVNTLTMMFTKNHVTSNLSGIFNNPLWYSLLLMAVLPAMIEEFAFRGIIYNGYKKSGNIKGAIFFTSLLFGCFHMNFNQFLYAFVMSLFMLLIYEATNSLFSTIIMHMLFNGFSTFAQYQVIALEKRIEQRINESEEYRKQLEQLRESKTITSYADYAVSEKIAILLRVFVIAVIGLTIAILLLRKIAKECNSTEKLKRILSLKKENPEQKSERIIDVPLAIALIICVLFMVSSF